MSKLPPFRLCIIAEQVRPEADGRSTINGFLGVAPEVSFAVTKFPILMNVCAYVLCGKASDSLSFDLDVEVVGPHGVILPRTKNTLQNLKPNATVSCALNFQALPFTQPGDYHIKVFSEGELHSDNRFTVSGKPS